MCFVTSRVTFTSSFQSSSAGRGGLKKLATPALLVSLLAISSMATAAPAAPQVLAKLAIELPADGHLTYQGQAVSQFPDGLPIGLGSGLSFVGKTSDGALQFVALTDRGPNGDAPQWLASGHAQESKIFIRPDFVPQWMTVTVKDGKAQASHPVLLHDAQGSIHGLPLLPGTVGATGEMALNDALQPIALTDSRGLDTEGLVADGQGGFWLCDEYGPFLIHVDGQGKILKQFGPEAQSGEQQVAGGLPSLLAWRQPNRGFEGVARLPSGKVIAAVQSTLDIDGKTAKSATFIRLLELDPQTGKTRMLAYPLESGFYKKNKDAKIGDLVAVDEQTLLVIEQGKDKDKQMHNRIYRLDLAPATDLSGQLIANKELEFADADALHAAGVVPVSKQLLVDLQSLGWSAEKAEGLTLVDGKTLAVTSDNDFGLGIKVKDKVGDAKDPTDYSTDGSGKLLLEGKPVASTLNLKPLSGEEAHSVLWLIGLPQSLR